MDDKGLMQKDLKLILRIRQKLDYQNTDSVKDIYERLVKENMFKTQLGDDFLSRLKSIIEGEEKSDLCYLCKKNIADNHAVCPSCLEKINQRQSEKEAANKASGNSNTYSDKESVGHDPNSREDFIYSEATKKAKEAVKKGYANLVSSVNKMTGEEGEVKFSLKDLGSNVFCKHSKSEEERIFIAGTELTTPDKTNISSEWPKPWLYSRVLLILLVVYFILLTTFNRFHNMNLLPGWT